MEEVKLLGFWPSPFSHRAIWALKLKGIKYEYVEEDIFNKSVMLLEYNPIHMSVPVLVHCGKPVAESMVIVEYIEETWPQNPLLPKDAYERSVARFWAKFVEDKSSALWTFSRSTGEEQEKAMKDFLEMLRTIEEYGLKEKKFFGGDKIGLADIAFGVVALWLEVLEDAAGVKFVEAHKFPRFHAWIKDFKEIPIIKENIPDRDKLDVYFKWRREKLIATP